MKISADVYEFLKSWLDWVESGAPEEGINDYSRHKGLCSSSWEYEEKK